MNKIVFFGILSLILLAALLLLSPVGTLDSRLYYSSQDAVIYFRGLTLVETSKYLFTELVDLLFITSYTILAWLCFRAVSLPKSLAFVCGGLDLVETVTVILCLTGGLEIDAVPWLSWVSLIKWVAAGIVSLTFAYAFVRKISNGTR